MSTPPLWIQLYYFHKESDNSEYEKKEDPIPFDVAEVKYGGNIAGLTELLTTEKGKETLLDHCDASGLKVYPPGTAVPIPKGVPHLPVDTRVDDLTKRATLANPLILVAPAPAPVLADHTADRKVKITGEAQVRIHSLGAFDYPLTKETPTTKPTLSSVSNNLGTSCDSDRMTANCNNDAAASQAEDPHCLDFTQDPPEDMTYGRRLALWLHRSYPGFYGSSRTSPEGPSLEKAWAFFEHVTLERYLVDGLVQNTHASSRSASADYIPGFLPGWCLRLIPSCLSMWWHQTYISRRLQQCRGVFYRPRPIAEPGERHVKTQLYPVFRTPVRQLGEFGIGVGVYFASIRNVALLLFLAGMVGGSTIQSISFYASKDYDSSGQKVDGVDNLLRGSAICTDRTWVPCPDCTHQDPINRFVTHTIVALEAGKGHYLNVTDYLDDGIIPPNNNEMKDYYETAPLNGSLWEALIDPLQHNLPLSTGRFIDYNSTEVTLWCGFLGPADCYLDLYPFLPLEAKLLDEDRNSLMGDTYVNAVPLHFAEKTNCNGATENQGVRQIVSLGVLMVYSFIMYLDCRKREVKFDEAVQSAQDYSIIIKNPPPDANGPDEWRDFFETALAMDTVIGDKNKVTVVTVNVDNERIVRYLVRRREILKRIENALPPNTPLDMDSLENDQTNPPIPKLVQKLKKINEKTREFFKTAEQPATTQVYITFETEAAQRRVLAKMTVGRRKQDRVPPHYLFRGNYALDVGEPGEPSTVRWEELNSTIRTRVTLKVLTSLVTLAFTVATYIGIRALYVRSRPWWASIATTMATTLFPYVAYFLMGLEKHQSEKGRQKWLLFKIATFNVLVTTVLLALTFPFQATLETEDTYRGLIPYVQYLFISQIFITPALQLLDITGNVYRHILAPRARTQAEMTLYMEGTPVELATLYANMIKFFVMTLWYSPIYPAGFFVGSLALFITFYADKFSMMRSWARSAQVGSAIANLTWKYYIPLAIVGMAFVSGYYMSGFPYDNLCLDESTSLPSYYAGDFIVNKGAEENIEVLGFNVYSSQIINASVSVLPDADAYKYCNQDLLRGSIKFPALPRFQSDGRWMTEEQEEMLSWFGWATLGIMIAVLGWLVLSWAVEAHRKYTGKYQPRGKEQHINYSEVPVIDSYIPEVKTPMIAYPLLLCDVDGIDRFLFNWQDEEHPHSHYDVTQDVAQILGTSSHPKVFAQVKHYCDPAKRSRLESESEELESTERLLNEP